MLTPAQSMKTKAFHDLTEHKINSCVKSAGIIELTRGTLYNPRSALAHNLIFKSKSHVLHNVPS